MVVRRSCDWPAPAKLNLFLHVVGQRPDGYHDLQTLFQFVDCCDWLDFTPNHEGTIELHTPIEGVAHDANLIVRAARLLQQETKTTQGAHIWIDKHLPQGGGLGGGSSNAATTLVALNWLWGCGLSTARLQALGRTLGADVPIFIHGAAAFAEGIGDHLHSMPDLDTPWYLILCPRVQVHTAAMFANPELPKHTAKVEFNRLDIQQTHNDFQELVLKNYAEVAKAFEWLVQYAPTKMTGTGACLFASFSSKEQAQLVLEQRPKHLDGFIALGTNRSPLITHIERLSKH
jgi:4-diphosphocytidyl-2-C-methyl-D-erythritol kinase